MIQVDRTDKPKVLVDNEVAWKAAIAVAANNDERKKAQKRYCRKPIKKAIVDMFHGKCAYCESRITHIEYGHIEHFKPKSMPLYYQLAVDWDNLLLACGICNGPEYKGTNFPDAANNGPLIDPSAENPAPHFKFDYDPKARIAAVLGVTDRGKTTVTTLGLDRRELVEHRSNFVTKLAVIAKSYATDPAAKLLVDEAVSENAEYLAFAIPIRESVL